MDQLQVIADPKRRRILQLVWDTERPASEIAAHFDVTFGAVSQHLAVLRRAGFVRVRKDGTKRLYQADRDALAPFRGALEAMWTTVLAGLAETIEREEALRSE